jgi:hypothetical protein
MTIPTYDQINQRQIKTMAEAKQRQQIIDALEAHPRVRFEVIAERLECTKARVERIATANCYCQHGRITPNAPEEVFPACKHPKTEDNTMIIKDGLKRRKRCRICVNARARRISSRQRERKVSHPIAAAADMSDMARRSARLVQRQFATGQHTVRGDALPIMREFVERLG